MKTLSIVGHTGFVGGHLASSRQADGLYNSSNFMDIPRHPHGLLVCAGVSAAKWKANADPEADMSSITRLWDVLSRAEVSTFVLVSTVDVYPDPRGVDEGVMPHLLPNHAYGRNRLALEEMVLARHPRALVLRLPALFGAGLRKNALYDMLNNRLLGPIDPESSFQWYGLDRLWADIDALLALPSRPSRVNLAVEPVRTGDIRDAFFPGLDIGSEVGGRPPARYDMRTRHAPLLGGDGGYIEGRDSVLARMGRWLSAERRAAA